MTNRVARLFAAVLAFAILTAACAGGSDALSERDLVRWLEAYGAAWEDRNAEAAAGLFTDDALYQETPFADPMRGRAAISAYWETVTGDQDDIAFDYELFAVNGTMGIAQWSARFRSISGDVPVELNGVFVLEFADRERVRSQREWWHAE
jgi:ketosteroid isomerase-like protein